MASIDATYSLNYRGEFPEIEVEGIEFNKPEFLCKCYSFNERNIAATISRKIFVSTPDLFNDLFDSLYLKINVVPEDFEFYKRLLSYVSLPIDKEEFLTSMKYRDKLRNSLSAIWTTKTGILCTTELSTNDLMWAHYTNNEGFLIQFDYCKFSENFGNPIPINYLKSDEFNKYVYSDHMLQLYVNSLIKKCDWSYENEYRFIVHPAQEKTFLTSGRFSNEDHDSYPKESRLQTYSAECVKKVILGFNFFKSLITNGNRVDFGKSGGLLKKALLDYTFKEGIKTEMLVMNPGDMKFKPIQFTSEKIRELLFEIKYAS